MKEKLTRRDFFKLGATLGVGAGAGWVLHNLGISGGLTSAEAQEEEHKIIFSVFLASVLS